MATLTAQFTDVNKLILNFKDLDLPYFVITDQNGNTLRKNESIEDVEEASEIIKNYLNSIDSSNRSIFTIRHYQKPTFKTGSKSPTEPDAISTFKLKATSEEIGAVRQYTPNNYLMEEIREQREEIKELRAELSALKLKAELNDNEDEDQDEDNEPDNLGGLGALINNPVVSNLLAAFTANLSQPRLPQYQPQAMAGVNDYQSEVLDLLFAKGVTNGDLHLLSQKPTEQINLLLSMLRNGN